MRLASVPEAERVRIATAAPDATNTPAARGTQEAATVSDRVAQSVGVGVLGPEADQPIGEHRVLNPEAAGSKPALVPFLLVLTTPEVAELLRLDVRTIRDMAGDGTLPARRCGRDWRFSQAHVMAWLGCEGRGLRSRRKKQ